MPVSERVRIHAGTQASRRKYKRSDFDQHLVSLHLGPHWLVDAATEASLLASTRQRWIGTAPDYRELGGRLIVTSLDAATHPGQALYESFYCARGNAENRLKEVKCDLLAERSSSNLFDANALRLYLSSFAHVLYNRVRRALATTPLAKANPITVRLRLFRIGARVTMSARRIHVAMPGACPNKTAFAAAWKALTPG